jgi:WD40 repeat protein
MENAPHSRESAFEKIRAGAHAALDRMGDLARAGAHPTLTALFCAGAAAPVIAAAVGAAPAAAALFGALGGISSGAFANVISGAIDRLKREPDDGSDHSIETWLAERLDELTAAEDTDAREIRRGMAELLSATEVIPAAVEAAFLASRDDLFAQLSVELESFKEFPEITRALRDTYAKVDSMHRDVKEFGFATLDYLTEIERLQRQSDEERRAGEEERRARDAERQASDIRLTARLVEVSARLGQLVEFSADPGAKPVMPKPGSPYLGLKHFTENDAAVFYGRDRHIARLLEHVSGTLEEGNLSMVTAASGAGKSSLLQAAFLPALAAGFLNTPDADHWTRSDSWPLAYTTPRDRPLERLADALAKHIDGVTSAGVLNDLRNHPEDAHMIARQALPDWGDDARGRLVIVIDQFEELFTLTESRSERERFVTAITSMTRGGADAPALVVIGVRSDFLGQCGGFERLQPALWDHLFLLTPMTIPEMRQAITGPAAADGLRLDEGLAEQILGDLSDSTTSEEFSPAALPLLSATMKEIFDRSGRGRLEKLAYSSFGGVWQALQESAERVYLGLTESERSTAARLFRSMVRVDRDGSLVRLPVSRKVLEAEADDARAVLAAFEQQRLLASDRETVEIAHDSLLSNWSRLADWLKDDKESLEVCSRLVEDAQEWAKRGEDPAFLYRGSRLANIETHQDFWGREAKRFKGGETDRAEQFLAASRSGAARRQRIRRALTGSIAGLMAVVLIAAAVAVQQNRALSAEIAETLSKYLAEESLNAGRTDGELARLLAAAAWEADETDEARLAMTNAVGNVRDGFLETGALSSVEQVEYSPNGDFVAGAAEEVAVIWDTDSWEERVVPTSMFGIASVDFSPDGSLLAVGGWNGVEIWETEDLTLRERLLMKVDQRTEVAFNPDGTRIVAADESGRFKIWETMDYTEVLAVSTGLSIEKIDFADNVIAITETIAEELPTLISWDPETGEERNRLEVEDASGPDWSLETATEGPINMLLCGSGACLTSDIEADATIAKYGVDSPGALSPDGSRIASWATDGIVLWDPKTREQTALFAVDEEFFPNTMVFAPDGERLLAGGSGGIQIWDLTRDFGHHSYQEFSPIRDVDISADGGRVLITNDEMVQIWEPGADPEVALTFDRWAGMASALSADGELAASPSVDDPHTIELWSLDGSEPVRLEGHTANLLDMEFSPDHTVLASAAGIRSTPGESTDAAVRLWDVGTGEPLLELGGHGDGAGSVAFNADGTLLATLGQDSTVQVWDAATGNLLHVRDPGVEDVYDIDFLDGTTELAVFRPNDIVRWDYRSGAERDITAFESVSFSNTGIVVDSGRYVVGMGPGNGLAIWDVETGDPAAVLPVGGWDATMGFAPDGTTLALAGEATWAVDLSFLQEPYAAVCAQVGRDLTAEERDRYLGEYDLTPCA